MPPRFVNATAGQHNARMNWMIVLATVLTATAQPAAPGDAPDQPAATARAGGEQLNSLWFINPDTGWVVGDQGVILHTADGGQTWVAQPSGTDAILEAVRFISPTVGWVVGGRPGPIPPRGRGVVLHTTDGGQSWQAGSVTDAGSLSDLWCGDESEVWVAGEAGPIRESGLWSTSSAGRTWLPGSIADPARVQGLDMAHFARGVAVGCDGLILPLRRRGLAPYEAEHTSQVDLHAAWHRTPTQAVAVGDDATVLLETDSGRRWLPAAVDLPAGLVPLIDLRDVCFADEQNGWAVGQPGGYLLRTADGGQTWALALTGQPRSLRAIHFVTPQVGYAVGEGGVICKTVDGGTTWSATGDARFAVLAISTPGNRTQWPLLAHLAGVRGWRCAYVQIGADDSADGEQATRQAAGVVGCSAVRVLTDLPAHGLENLAQDAVLARWSTLLDRDAGAEVVQWLAAAIRSYQPAVVVVDADERSGVSALVARLALEAIAQAGNATVQQDLELVGLRPHEVQRTWVAEAKQPAGGRADVVRIAYLDEPAELLGDTPYYAAVRAIGCLDKPSIVNRPAVGAAFTLHASADGRPARDICAGLGLDDRHRLTAQPQAADREHLRELPTVQRALRAEKQLVRGHCERLLSHAADAALHNPATIAPADVVLEAAAEALADGQPTVHREAVRTFPRYWPAAPSLGLVGPSHRGPTRLDGAPAGRGSGVHRLAAAAGGSPGLARCLGGGRTGPRR